MHHRIPHILDSRTHVLLTLFEIYVENQQNKNLFEISISCNVNEWLSLSTDEPYVEGDAFVLFYFDNNVNDNHCVDGHFLRRFIQNGLVSRFVWFCSAVFAIFVNTFMHSLIRDHIHIISSHTENVYRQNNFGIEWVRHKSTNTHLTEL